MSAAGDARGGCHCGAVRFVARFPSRFVAHCHCASCRRAHGAAFVTWAGFPSDQVAVSEGTELLKVHVSSPGTKRSFCGAVISAASRSRVLSGCSARLAAVCSSQKAANGQAGATSEPGGSVTSTSALRPPAVR